jgi:hypothetical protein
MRLTLHISTRAQDGRHSAAPLHVQTTAAHTATTSGEAPVGIEPTIAVLQTAALPLGHGAQRLGRFSHHPRRGKKKTRVASGQRHSRSTRTTIAQLLQTGMLFIITQQLHPCCIIIDMHSHAAWIIAIIAASPLV